MVVLRKTPVMGLKEPTFIEHSHLPDVVLRLVNTSSLEHECITVTGVLLLTDSLSKRKQASEKNHNLPKSKYQ